MYCPKCGMQMAAGDKYCRKCGGKRRGYFPYFLVVLISLLAIGFFAFDAMKFLDKDEASVYKVQEHQQVTASTSEEKEQVAQEIEQPEDEELIRELTDIIADAQQTVYTIESEYSQGSGFLYNDEGIVVTNAHVVEGNTDVVVTTIQETKHRGKVIGYSNENDVAIIRVDDFVGRSPSNIEVDEKSLVGEEVIALGSPLGLENTATMGYVTGVDRSFYIDHYSYSNLYQISAPIAPGSSGGPLVSQKTEKVIAINSVQDTRNTTIGFSIPIYTVHSMIETWIEQPMSEEDIYAQFYYTDDLFYFDYLWELEDGWYFDDGSYSDEDVYYEYWEYDFWEWYDEYWEEYYDYWYDDEFDDWYDEYEDWYDEEDFDWYDADYDWDDDEEYDWDYDDWYDAEDYDWFYDEEYDDEWWYE
ncbi:trypsin-like peptidase domain-containing protein [Bacillus sp. JCM 19034]|uniref:trypsin-like peptidase domain-containing protein n=1 Tax=Bacillus sp. JCM 19034 TaxID=1481928 RepID=UPI0009E71809|nr:trypsin-like peptidase domain-containing protein [Bacillus sp. JCM 19034]